MAELPLDAIFDILSRLPAKSLAHFRCVSKPWCAYIDDDYFGILHGERALEELTPIMYDPNQSSITSFEIIKSKRGALKAKKGPVMGRNQKQNTEENLYALTLGMKNSRFDIIKSEEVHTILEAKKGMSLNRKHEPCSTDPRYFAGVSLILVFLNKDFDSFVQNYNMHGMGKTVNELHAMLKLHEETLPKKDANPTLHTIRTGRVHKNQKNKPHKPVKGGHGKGKGKIGYAPNNVPFSPKPKTHPPRKKDNPANDAICHQCGEVGHWRRNCPVYLAELMKKKKLSQGASTLSALSLYVGDGHRAAVEEIGTYHLELPSGLVIVLNNCHYAPSITRDSSLLWRYRLGHISKKRIEKLQHDGLLNSINIESLGKCVLCLSGKMARKPCSHQMERAKDLLGLIHTDVYGPFRIMSNKELTTLTFTDDFSRYGYVYLLKHKNEVFETFKEHELGDLGEPANYKAALLDPESKKWLDAMNVEMQSMKDNDAWVLVELPPNARTIGSKWLFKKKTDMDGAVYVFKARLVAKGFTQTYGILYGNSKRGTIPMQEKLKLSKSQGASTPAEKQRMQNVPYGSIMYVVRCNRPDVAFVQNITSRFQQNPGEEHWTTVKNILKYLRNTKDMFLVYGGNTERELMISCYTDAGYLTDADDLKS
uniref:Zinc finger, CCHC-type n=1 Tax=Tanacetum cinerariifolium TaxID=118510 RepID=A0A699H994_TANCI|nr:zinc finger, CCHC-type [Tanacetum cinerariifolium]